MSGVWVFRNGVVHLIENPELTHVDGRGNVRRKVLFHIPTNKPITSHEELGLRLMELGWERYLIRDHPHLLQYHKETTSDLISIPKDFNMIKSVHMFDIVVKCRNVFEVRDVVTLP